MNAVKLAERIQALERERDEAQAESVQWQEAAGQSLIRAEAAEDERNGMQLQRDTLEYACQEAYRERDEAREQVRVLREFVSDLDGYASAHRHVDSAQLKVWIIQLRKDMEPKL